MTKRPNYTKKYRQLQRNRHYINARFIFKKFEDFENYREKHKTIKYYFPVLSHNEILVIYAKYYLEWGRRDITRIMKISDYEYNKIVELLRTYDNRQTLADPKDIK